MLNLLRHIVPLSLLSALTIACSDGGEPVETSTGESTGGSTGGSTEGSGGPTTSGTTDADGTTTPTSSTGEPASACEAYVEWYTACEFASDLTTAECEEWRADQAIIYGPDCVDLYDVFLVCRTTLACDFGCQEELEASRTCKIAVGELCEAYTANVVACDPAADAAKVARSCQLDVNMGFATKDGCGLAHEEYFTCLADATCELLNNNQACISEISSINVNCDPLDP